MKKIFLIVNTLIVFSISACTKHKDDVEDTTPKASIQFYNPTQNAVYKSTDSVAIEAKAISTATIHGYDIVIRKAEDTSRLYFKHIHDHNDTLNVASKWSPTVANTSLQVEIVLYLDHDGHTGSKKVNFRVQ